MEQDGHTFSEEQLITEVISKNIPSVWMKDFKLGKLHTSGHAASQLIYSVSSLCVTILLLMTTIVNMTERLHMKMTISK